MAPRLRVSAQSLSRDPVKRPESTGEAAPAPAYLFFLRCGFDRGLDEFHHSCEYFPLHPAPRPHA
jgi:hypothetical protein